MDDKTPSAETPETKAFKSGPLAILGVMLGMTLVGMILDTFAGWKFGVITSFFFFGGIMAAVMLTFLDASLGRRHRQ